MNLLIEFLDRRYCCPDISQFDPSEADVFEAPRDQLIGVVLGEEIVGLNRRYHCSFRMKLRNLENLQNFALTQLPERLDKAYVGQYLSENQDNPYGLQNIINCIRRGEPVRNLTQFPPLYRKKTETEHRRGLDKLRAATQVGDLVCTANRRSGVSRLIQKFDRCQFSHGGMVYQPGRLAEMTTSGVAKSCFEDLYDPSFDVALYRPIDLELTPEQEATIEQMWSQRIKYNWLGILKIYLIKRLHLPLASVHTAGDMLYLNRLRLVADV